MRCLGSLSEFITSGSRGWAAFYSERGALFIRSQNVRDGRLDFDDTQYVTPPNGAEGNRTRVKRKDLLITITGNSVGNVALVENELGEAYISQHVGLVRLSEPTLGYYVCRFLSPGSPGNTQIWANQSGQSKPGLTLRDLQGLWVALPPTEDEGLCIAEALRDVDALLDGLDRLIAKKRDLKQAAMQQLLTGQTRLPEFKGKWRTTRLRRFVTSARFAIVDGPFGSQLKVDEYVESGVPVIEMEHLSDGFITERIERCITPKKFEDLKRSAVYPGDIIISKTGSLGKLGIIPGAVERGLITSRLAKITLDTSRADRSFVFQFLLKLRNEGYWEKVSQGGTMQILGIGMLQNAPIPNISVHEQTAIAGVLTDMDVEMTALEQRRQKTRALKLAMMQELLTGRTRLI